MHNRKQIGVKKAYSVVSHFSSQSNYLACDIKKLSPKVSHFLRRKMALPFLKPNLAQEMEKSFIATSAFAYSYSFCSNLYEIVQVIQRPCQVKGRIGFDQPLEQLCQIVTKY